MWANWLDVGSSLIGFEEPRALEPWARQSGGLSSTPYCGTAPGCCIRLEWKSLPVVVPLMAPTRSLKSLGGPSTKRGLSHPGSLFNRVEIESVSKEINCAEHEYMNMSPSLNELATPLVFGKRPLAG